ncbi:MAG: hypothetical protein GY922_15185 [Proteobacteria bacterium]|nr:hypothetical protein [Pseudomonadota bacterium]
MTNQATKVCVSQTLYSGTQAVVELPMRNENQSYTWADVEDFYVKWDTLHLTMKDDSTHEIEMESRTDDEIIDWKRPKSVEVYSLDEKGFTGEILAED